MFIKNGKIKILFKVQPFYLFTSLISCLLESGLLCVNNRLWSLWRPNCQWLDWVCVGVYCMELISPVWCVELIGSSKNVHQTYLLLSRLSAVFWSSPHWYIWSKVEQILVFCVSFSGASKCFGGSFVHRRRKLFTLYRGRSERKYGHSSFLSQSMQSTVSSSIVLRRSLLHAL